MLRLLFEFLQSLLGSSLRTVALWLYAGAAVAFLLACFRRWARGGVRQR